MHRRSEDHLEGHARVRERRTGRRTEPGVAPAPRPQGASPEVTVFPTTQGFGARSVMRTTHVLRRSSDLPMAVETAAQVEELEATLGEVVPDGLVAIENVHVSRYAERPGPKAKG